MLVVRNMSKSDVEAIVELEQESFSDAWSKKSVSETFEGSQTFVVVAEEDGKILGYCIVYFVMDEAEIARVAVKESCRRQGVGRKLLEDVEKICIEKQIKRLLLDVREGNVPAKMFYANYGFVADGIRKDFYAMPRENAILMSKIIDNGNQNKD